MAIQPRNEVLLNAANLTVASPFQFSPIIVTTSRAVGVDNASHLSLQITGSNITSGSAVFTVQVSNDVTGGTNWVTYNRLIPNYANTNAQLDTRIGSTIINANASTMLFFPEGDTFNRVRVVATPNNQIDGTYTAVLYIN